jgi:hypothetical protein
MGGQGPSIAWGPLGLSAFNLGGEEADDKEKGTLGPVSKVS